MKIDTKTFNKILMNQIRQEIKRTYDLKGLLKECKVHKHMKINPCTIPYLHNKGKKTHNYRYAKNI